MLQEIDREKCTGCGSCFKSCGLDVFRLDTDQSSVAHCQWACPTGVDIRGYVYLLQQGKIRDAAEILMAANPLPALTGRTCHRFCEGKCARTKVDDAVNINALEQYVGDWVLGRSPEPGFIRHIGKIGVIGSGAAGMSCAYYLNHKGYAVTVFESEEQPGGLFRTAHPELTSGVLDSQIDYLGKLGIVFECGVTVGDGREVTLEQLREKDYKAFLLAVGAAEDKTKRAVPPFSSVASITEDSLISVSPGAYVTSSKDVFAAGNATGGGNSVAHAIAGGREAAESIDATVLSSWETLADEINYLDPEGLTHAPSIPPVPDGPHAGPGRFARGLPAPGRPQGQRVAAAGRAAAVAGGPIAAPADARERPLPLLH